jgi:hypothetical protein
MLASGAVATRRRAPGVANQGKTPSHLETPDPHMKHPREGFEGKWDFPLPLHTAGRRMALGVRGN